VTHHPAKIVAALALIGLIVGLGISQPWQASSHRPTVNCAVDRDHDCPSGEKTSELLERTAR
jgi:hypothetical protein